jgi:hypothetical protein
MMGQSLSTVAVAGNKSYRPSEAALDALAEGNIEALLAAQKSRFGGFLDMMADEDDDDNSDDDDDDTGGDDDDDEEDDDADDDDDDEDKDLDDATKKRIKKLSDENAKWRNRHRRRGERITELERELQELKKGKTKSKSKDDEEDAGGDSEDSELKAENEKLKQQLFKQELKSQFTDLVTGKDAVAVFKNNRTAFKLLDLDEVDVDDDGEIIGLEDAVKALAKSDPYLLDADDDDDDDDETPKRTGKPPRRKKTTGNPDREKLLKKYPALATRG